jgi:large subunit ribosomal protein L22
MKAFLKNYRQSPRKVRLVAELIKGKRVAEALLLLDTLPKRASLPLKKLVDSAVSNASSNNSLIDPKDLFVENITVNKGIVLKRIMPRARGSASRINKRTSHVFITLTEKKIIEKIKEEVKSETEKKIDVKKEQDKKPKVAKKVESDKKSK